MKAEPYLFFEGRCEEALEFYTQALGAKVGMVMRYKDAPDKPPEGMIAPGSDTTAFSSRSTIQSVPMMAAWTAVVSDRSAKT